MLTKDKAICIRTVDYSETSQIVTFFTRQNGKIDVIAKGAKRPKSPFGGPIEMLSSGQAVFSAVTERKLATLTEFEQQAAPSAAARDYFSLNCALFAAELVSSLVDDLDPHPSLFDQLLKFLENIANSKNNIDTLVLLILFQLGLLSDIGLRPVLKACINCKTPFSPNWPQAYFSSSANGLVCRDCEPTFSDRVAISKRATNCLTELKMLANAPQSVLDEIETILIRHFTELLHRPPRMAKYIVSK
jgi:DNA repair protein RecO (recombination protein O)